ncbi:hypothetical protein [Desulfomonile tiedjei]|uniref:Uncharacterized protein n=1 Tax=Desulfomonile tiedjei (strain ATCC 49306 / DSM 6799 / DCB-1) TaxID=706587 RepID=I4C373_DESTA|nr:hypothetical protein [Desulfomonile tiedjei]AFM24014.1 hypothetical protein Desti_1301 [Desulfomonile tiedjei DSM 6799]
METLSAMMGIAKAGKALEKIGEDLGRLPKFTGLGGAYELNCGS